MSPLGSLGDLPMACCLCQSSPCPLLFVPAEGPLLKRSCISLAVSIFISLLTSKYSSKRVHYLPRIPHAARHIHDGFVADDVGEAVDLSEELRLRAVDILSLPEACGHHQGANLHRDASGKHACQCLLDVRVYFLDILL